MKEPCIITLSSVRFSNLQTSNALTVAAAGFLSNARPTGKQDLIQADNPDSSEFPEKPGLTTCKIEQNQRRILAILPPARTK